MAENCTWPTGRSQAAAMLLVTSLRPNSSHMIHAERLGEVTELPHTLQGALLTVEEQTAPPSRVKSVLARAGISVRAAGRRRWQATLDLPVMSSPFDSFRSLVVQVVRADRTAAADAGQRLSEQLARGQALDAEWLATELIGASGGDAPSVLMSRGRVPGIGEVQLVTAAGSLVESLRTLRWLVPNARLTG